MLGLGLLAPDLKENHELELNFLTVPKVARCTLSLFPDSVMFYIYSNKEKIGKMIKGTLLSLGCPSQLVNVSD